MISYKHVALERIRLNAATQRVYDNYLKRFGNERKRGIYRYKNFPRFSHVIDKLEPGGRALDVGVFTGQFLDALTQSGKFSEVVGIDLVEKAGFWTESSGYTRITNDVATLAFRDRAFDAVICMEVLEHLPVEDFPKALAELRRVCRGHLIMTVPYDEQPPLSAHHTQSFPSEKLARYFGGAEISLLCEAGKPIWALIEEGRPTGFAYRAAQALPGLRRRSRAST